MNNSKHKPFRTVTSLVPALILLLWGGNAMSLEQPEYTVLYEADGVEFRQYESYLVSETIVSGAENYKKAGNEGFKRLFRYITGANTASAEISMTVPVQQQRNEKISMTAPVQQTQSADGYSITFMLPAKYTLETAPAPTDPRVRVREVPARTVAVLRYSGRWTQKNFVKRQSQLQEALEESGVEALGEYQSALYNAPYVPPFMRRNEVLVTVNRLPEAAVSQMEQQMAAY